jgi:hypothetical protein
MRALKYARVVLLFTAFALFASTSWALTPAQLTTLKADIVADGTLNAQPNNSDGNSTIAAAYNLNASPDYWVWRTAVSKAEYVGATSIDGTTFNWTGTGYITRAQGERDAWNQLFDAQGYANPSLPQVRQAVADIFSGATAPAPANRTHLLTVSRRKATRAEKLFATGSGTTASPSVMAFQGQISYQDVESARNLP